MPACWGPFSALARPLSRYLRFTAFDCNSFFPSLMFSLQIFLGLRVAGEGLFQLRTNSYALWLV